MTPYGREPRGRGHLVALLVVLCLAAALTACGSSSSSGAEAAEGVVEESEPAATGETEPPATTEATPPPPPTSGGGSRQLSPEVLARFTGSGTLTVDGQTFRFASACAKEEELEKDTTFSLGGMGEHDGRSFTLSVSIGDRFGFAVEQIYVIYDDQQQQRLAYESLDDGITVDANRVTYEGDFAAGVTANNDGRPVGRGSFEATCS